MNKTKKYGLSIKDTIYQHIINNRKEYIIISLMFLIGIFLGVMFINNVQDIHMSEITSYFDSFIEKLKNIKNIESIKILKNSIFQNLTLAMTLWFFGTTVIGIPIVFGIILYRGFCLGYTVATIISIMGTTKGISFIFITLVLQNIIFIPSMIAIGVSRF